MRIRKYDKQQGITDFTTWRFLNLARNSIYRLRELELAPFGLTVEQSITLSILINRGGAASSKTLEELTLRQHHSISTLVNRMIKIKLVNKSKISDRKKNEILISEYGASLYKKVPICSLESVFSSLKEIDRKQFSDCLNALLKKARDLLGISFVPPFLLKPVNERDTGKKYVQENQDNRELTDFELWMLLNRTRNSLYRVRELELAQFNLTVEQSAIMYLLINRGGAVTAKTIEEITMRQHHSISTLINRMMKMKLVTRRKNPVTQKPEIQITEYGEDLYKQVPAHSIEMLFANVKETDIILLFNCLNILLEKARDLLGLSCHQPS